MDRVRLNRALRIGMLRPTGLGVAPEAAGEYWCTAKFHNLSPAALAQGRHAWPVRVEVYKLVPPPVSGPACESGVVADTGKRATPLLTFSGMFGGAGPGGERVALTVTELQRLVGLRHGQGGPGTTPAPAALPPVP